MSPQDINTMISVALEQEHRGPEFVEGMRHHLLTMAKATRLLAETKLDVQQQECVGAIRNGADALLTLLNDILDLSDREAGKLALEKVPLDLWKVVDAAVEGVTGQVRSKGIELACWIQPEVALGVLGDPARMGEVLANLLSASVEFAKRGGEILLLVSVEEEDERSISLRVTLSENGTGMSEEMQQRVLAPFALSREIVRRMGGEMGIDSVADIGPTFWFTARLEKQPEWQGDATMIALHALVVTGRPTIRKFLSNHLRFLGLRNSTAGNAVEGASVFAEKEEDDPFNLVLIDLSLSLARTLEAARGVIAVAQARGCPVVILLPAHEPIAPNFLKEQNVAACLVKPVLHQTFSDTFRGLARTRNGAPCASSGEAGKPFARILVVEDNEVNQKVAVMQLRKLGYEADIAADGLLAVSVTQERDYEIIFMDCQLPGMDGYEATRKIREQEAARTQGNRRGRRSRIVAITSSAIQEERRKCLDAGMDDFLPKPVHSEDLRKTLERWLSKDGGGDTPSLALEEKSMARLPVSQSLGDAVVDVRRLMDCVDGDRTELRLLLEQYLRETSSHLAQIEESIQRGAFEEMSRRAHRCGGSSATVGMRAIVIPLRAIEQLGIEQTVQGAFLQLAEARTQLELIREFLKTHPETAPCYPAKIPPNA